MPTETPPHFSMQPLPLSLQEAQAINVDGPREGYIPEPWMVRAYFESPDEIPEHEREQLTTYIKEHPQTEKSYRDYLERRAQRLKNVLGKPDN